MLAAVIHGNTNTFYHLTVSYRPRLTMSSLKSWMHLPQAGEMLWVPLPNFPMLAVYPQEKRRVIPMR